MQGRGEGGCTTVALSILQGLQMGMAVTIYEKNIITVAESRDELPVMVCPLGKV